jgi:putative nucleotidyltransferase with HDIG domain
MDQVASALGYGVRTLRDAVSKEQYQRDLHVSLEQTIQVIADTVDRRDPYTAGHQRRVADLSVHIARQMGLDEERVHGLRLAAIIHDLGKVGIPVEILAKPGRLTPTQMSLVKEHVEIGYEIIKDVKFPWPIADIVRQHHERLNGSGYPRGLSAGLILLESKILAVADVVEAMATHRPYRTALGIDAALEEVDKGRGSLYDSGAVDACIHVFREKGYQLPS